MKPELLAILQHTIGADRYGLRSPHSTRNHFVAGGDNIARCRELVALGFMREREDNGLTGGSPWFSATRAGIEAVSTESPAPPKLTRSQLRYREYVKVADCFGSFLDFLRYKEGQRKGLFA